MSPALTIPARNVAVFIVDSFPSIPVFYSGTKVFSLKKHITWGLSK